MVKMEFHGILMPKKIMQMQMFLVLFIEFSFNQSIETINNPWAWKLISVWMNK